MRQPIIEKQFGLLIPKQWFISKISLVISTSSCHIL